MKHTPEITEMGPQLLEACITLLAQLEGEIATGFEGSVRASQREWAEMVVNKALGEEKYPWIDYESIANWLNLTMPMGSVRICDMKAAILAAASSVDPDQFPDTQMLVNVAAQLYRNDGRLTPRRESDGPLHSG